MTARLIAAEIKDSPWLKAAPKLKISSEIKTVEIPGDLWQALSGAKPPSEELPLCFVTVNNDTGSEPVKPDRASPVILLGDSHNLIFNTGGDMHAEGAGLADQLAKELGIAVYLLGVRGSGATPSRINLLRRVQGDPDYLKSKKLIIWCMSVREFTESSGWRNVPIVK